MSLIVRKSINIATPTQVGNYKAVMKEADRIKKELKKNKNFFMATTFFWQED